MIQFACPSCRSTCRVDDRYAGRKARCPKCGARILHLKDSEVKLLTAGTAHPPQPAAPADGAPPPQEVTPLATAVLPHSVGELVGQSESKQNFYVGAGLLGFFALVAIMLGFILGIRLLVVLPIAVVLSAVGIYLWLHTRKLRRRLLDRQRSHDAATPPK